MSAPARDDLLTGIHKALRLGLLRVTVQLGAADWAHPGDREAAGTEWQRLSGLLRSHASHEDRHIFALLEAKRPGSLAALHADHEELDPLQDQLDRAVQDAARGTAAGAGPRVYARAAAFTGRYLAHLDAEDRTVMPGIWEACSDEEIAGCRAAFMAEIGPEEAAYTQGLVLPALSTPERVAMLASARHHLAPQAYARLLRLAEEVLAPEPWRRTAAALQTAA
jgi:Hemerythrin HHE cation binding domain